MIGIDVRIIRIEKLPKLERVICMTEEEAMKYLISERDSELKIQGTTSTNIARPCDLQHHYRERYHKELLKEREVLGFIQHFRNKGTIKTFTEGCCYYFALILKERFDGKIVYDDVNNHFACRIGIWAYDITGRLYGNYVDWDEYQKKEPLNAGRVIRDCITKENK